VFGLRALYLALPLEPHSQTLFFGFSYFSDRKIHRRYVFKYLTLLPVLTSDGDSPTSASHVAGITEMHHHHTQALPPFLRQGLAQVYLEFIIFLPQPPKC
jgi:hypothetical protein